MSNNNNSVLALTPTPSSSSSSSSSQTPSTATTTALDKSSTVELNFNQSTDNQIGATANFSNSVTNSNHSQNNPMENGQTNSLNHSSIVNHVKTSTTATNHMVNAPIVAPTPPLVLNLSQVSFIVIFQSMIYFN